MAPAPGWRLVARGFRRNWSPHDAPLQGWELVPGHQHRPRLEAAAGTESRGVELVSVTAGERLRGESSDAGLDPRWGQRKGEGEKRDWKSWAESPSPLPRGRSLRLAATPVPLGARGEAVWSPRELPSGAAGTLWGSGLARSPQLLREGQAGGQGPPAASRGAEPAQDWVGGEWTWPSHQQRGGQEGQSPVTPLCPAGELPLDPFPPPSLLQAASGQQRVTQGNLECHQCHQPGSSAPSWSGRTLGECLTLSPGICWPRCRPSRASTWGTGRALSPFGWLLEPVTLLDRCRDGRELPRG